MPYNIEFMPDAQEHLGRLTARQQAILLDKIQEQLHHQPAEETKQRKKLRPNPLASWELKVREFRVFFDIDEQEQTVFIIAIGRKRRNELYVGSKEFKL